MLRRFYLISVGLLVVLVVATLASPFLLPLTHQQQDALPETASVQVMERPDEWILQYQFVNDSPAPATFPYTISFDGQEQQGAPYVNPGDPYQLISHIPRDEAPSGQVHFTLSRSGSPTPLEDLTLYLSSPQPPSSGGQQ